MFAGGVDHLGARLVARFAGCVLLSWVAVAGAPPSAAQVVKPSEKTLSCANSTCHASTLAHKVQHGPAAQKKCEACHVYDDPRQHTFKLANSKEKLCTDCHAVEHRTVVHKPVKEGNCTGCHDPHGSEHKGLLVADVAKGLCLTCHKQDFSSKKFVHGPVNTGACILCHEAHSGWQPKLLTETPDKLCTGCHNEMITKTRDARHVHAPVKESNCTACHDPHASDVRHQLHAANSELCLSCHKETAKVLASHKVVHGALKEEDGCGGCHSPHFSQLPKLQKASQPESCLSCHDKAMNGADGKQIPSIAALLKENPHQHGPIREGACTACHHPHGAENFRLLAAEYPQDFYAAFKIERYALCFNCHIPDLVLKEQGTGLTRFRNGDVNLHWVHVNREKGRTCRACHEVHASQHPFHLRESVPFGNRGWKLEVGFKPSPSGGTCATGCHQEKGYDRGPDRPGVNSEVKHVRPSVQTSSTR